MRIFKSLYILGAFVAPILFISSCNSSQKTEQTDEKTLVVDSLSIENEVTPASVVDEYLSMHEIEAFYIINNLYSYPYFSEDKGSFVFANHRLSYSYDDENRIKISIDGVLLKLKDKITKNDSWSCNDDSIQGSEMSFPNKISTIKYYKFFDQEVVAIQLFASNCNGTGCGVNHYLFYDLKECKENYFAVFRSDFEIKFYNFKNSINYLSTRYCDGDDGNFYSEYTLYRLSQKGNFEIVKDEDDNKYYIRTTYGGFDRFNWFENFI